ncbi:MAG: FliI/YscN family ATPase [Pirellulales bacterium]|nr:FliI/YscN family ATPase [Pirellulales bacterium]
MTELLNQLERVMPTEIKGRVARTVGMAIHVNGFPAPLGATAMIQRETGSPLFVEVVGIQENTTIVSPLGSTTGVRRGDQVRLVKTGRWIRVGDGLLGRVVNAFGEVIDGHPASTLNRRTDLDSPPPSAVNRPRISEILPTGVRVMDAMLTCGRGQRMGVFAGSGVGKSVLLGMMARYTGADVSVIALIGERGREVNEFIENELGEEGLKRSVVVVATSDEPAQVRVRAAMAATAIAESFRARGQHVLLLMDSLTRFAQAQREIGLAAGEPPATRGYPPSVFAALPKLVERAGCTKQGSITGFYSVLVEADDPQEPIADAVRGLLDGHTWLSRGLASRGHYPAVDVLESLSRLMPQITTPEHLAAARRIREILAAYRDHEDLISIGAYRPGANTTVDVAIAARDQINAFLQQAPEQNSGGQQGIAQLIQLANVCQLPTGVNPAVQAGAHQGVSATPRPTVATNQ